MDENQKLLMLVGQLERLPTLPTVCLRANELMTDPNSSATDIGSVIAHDQVIAAKLLGIVNSSFYGFRQRITTVTRAMTMIGFRGLKDLILTLGALPALRLDKSHENFNATAFWSHSVGVATCARSIAMTLQMPNPEEAFTAGLLHDIGKIAEYQFLTEEFMAIQEEAHLKNIPLYEVEKQRNRFSHADVGDLLAKRWRFSESLIECIACHHTPSLAHRHPREVAIIHLADIIARAKLLGDPYDQRVPPLDTGAWETAGLKTNQLNRLMANCDVEFEKSKIFISILKDN